MRKLISTLTSLAMTATLAAGSIVAPITANANSGQVHNTTYKTLEVKVDKPVVDVSTGDAKVWATIYLDESTADSRFLVAYLQVDGGLKFTGEFKDPVTILPTVLTGGGTLLDGTTVATRGDGLFFAGRVAGGTFTPRGVIDQEIKEEIANDPTRVGFVWAVNETYTWLGTKSSDYQVMSFEINVPAGTPAGTYNVSFDDSNKSAPGSDPACVTAMADDPHGTIDTLSYGGLALVNTTITVQNGTTSGSSTTTTSTTTSTTTTTTTNGGGTDIGGVEVIENAYNLKINDEKVNKISAGDEILVPIVVNGVPNSIVASSGIGGCDIAFTYDRTYFTYSGLEFCTLGSATSSPAANYEANGGQRLIISNGTDGGYNPTLGEEVIYVIFTAKSDVPDGTYPIEWNPNSRMSNVQPSGPISLTVGFHNGSIQVGQASTGTTTTASSTTTTTTTTAGGGSTTTTTTNGSGGTVLYGDANCNGVVNIADVVCLNKAIANPTAYALTAQGKLNADVNNDGNQNATDAGYIIEAIIKLRTLPV